MTVMHNDCCLGGGESRRSKEKRKILDNTDTESSDFLFAVGPKWIQTHESECHFLSELITRRAFHPSSRVRSALDLAFDVVALAEEGEPVVEYFLVLVREVRPIRTALLRLERGLSESTRSILAGEDFEAIVSAAGPG